MTIQQHCRTSLFCHQMCKVARILLFGFLLVAVLGVCVSSSATAGTITLSEIVSKQFEMDGVTPLPDPIDPDDLDATLEFMITGTTLNLTVTNLTSGDELFDMNEVYFNVTSNVMGLTYVSATHSVGAADVKAAWSFVADDGSPGFSGTHGDGFGIQDFALMDGKGANNPNDIGPTESIDFEFTILGAGPFDMDDFTTTLSRQTEDVADTLTLAAAKFVNRRDSAGVLIEPNDSGYGGTVTVDLINPEPSTFLLAALALVALLAHGRRRPRA